ncbi:MAG TPA: IclR family transcriptional regulator C-terminal domain-containing protein [Xanthobacteraceae bacterium]|jgi:IclR family pca regulon transcriptional regulator|nr:IclR family transcriptional regulator C-terminal domain-containing protein [Xanthobacteraceae bacterium]
MDAVKPGKPQRPRRKGAPRSNSGPAARFAFVQSLERGLAVIKSFGEHKPEQTLSQVADATGLDRAAARRFLLTLERLGYVEQNGRSFRLRPQTLQLGYAYLSSLPWWQNAQRVAERLADKFGQNCAIGVLDGHQVLYVAYASAARFPVLNRSVGTHLPAFATAIGRLLLAGLDPAALHERLSSGGLEKLTPHTVVDRTKIARILAEIRSNRYAFVDQELEIGLRSIGVPIVNRRGELLAAMSISIIDSRMSRAAIVDRYLEPLQTASREITDALAT